MILIYAFSNRWGTNISHRVLLELQKFFLHPLPCQGRRSALEEKGIGGRVLNKLRGDFVFELIHSYPHDFFHRHIEHKNYSLIVGLGDGPKNSQKIHLETQAKNVYLNKEIYPFSPILLDLNLPAVDNYDSTIFKISSNMGTYNCNYLVYRTQLYLNQKSPNTLHLFLHLPPQSNAQLLSNYLLKFFTDNHLF